MNNVKMTPRKRVRKQIMGKRDTYHHGDLRSALIEAGETVLEQSGVEKFSLRQVARLVGVSPSAPAHHFGDTLGLLTAMAAQGFRQLLASMESHHRQFGPDNREALIGSGIGYLEFAKTKPGLFALMFGPPIRQETSVELQCAGEAAFEHLAQNVEKLTGKSRCTDPDVMEDIMASWSIVHGFSNLVISDGLQSYQEKSNAEKLAFFQAVISRTIPD